jgi:hypothetical protein
VSNLGLLQTHTNLPTADDRAAKTKLNKAAAKKTKKKTQIQQAEERDYGISFSFSPCYWMSLLTALFRPSRVRRR